MHNFTKTSVAAMLFGLFAATASADTQTVLSENFDVATHFSDGATVPDGWASTGTYPLSRQTGSYFGASACSGDYVLGTPSSSSSYNRDEAVYTKPVSLKAGTEYTLSFEVLAPGNYSSTYYYTNINVKAGTAQSSESMTTDLGSTNKALISSWTQCSYKFTPEADGDYVFGLFLETQLNNAGYVLFDDFELTYDDGNGGSQGGDDDDKVTVEVPYSQSFDNENKDYDGTTYVPTGWLSVGSAPFVTANISDLPAKDGTYYLIAPESTVSRDDRIYTPFFDMTAGTEYSISFYLYMPGDGDNSSNFSLTVGTEQDSEFHTTSLLSLENYTNMGWEKQTATFTPAEDGKYCFSLALGGEAALAGEACIDLFTVTAPGLIAKPKANFAVTGYYDIMSSKLVVFKGASLQMVNTSTDAETSEWTVDGLTDGTSSQTNPWFTFTKSGDYTVTLTVKNVKGENTTSKTFSISVVEKQESLGLDNHASSESIMTRDNTPYFSTHANADWVLGVNHYYNKFAERFNVPEGYDYEITSATVWLCWYGLASRYYSTEQAKPVKIVAYAEKDGRPDLDNAYGSFETTMSSLFGTTGLSKAEMRGLPFGNTITAKGPFYLAFEFADDLWISETDANLSRTVLGLGGFYHGSKETTFYVLPRELPATATCTVDGGYWPVDKVDSEYKGLGLELVVWMNVTKNGQTTSIAVAPSGKTVFAARLSGDQLTVSGTQSGEAVTVYNSLGQVVSQTAGDDQSTAVSLSGAPAGVYVVKTAAGTQKFFKK